MGFQALCKGLGHRILTENLKSESQIHFKIVSEQAEIYLAWNHARPLGNGY